MVKSITPASSSSQTPTSTDFDKFKNVYSGDVLSGSSRNGVLTFKFNTVGSSPVEVMHSQLPVFLFSDPNLAHFAVGGGMAKVNGQSVQGIQGGIVVEPRLLAFNNDKRVKAPRSSYMRKRCKYSEYDDTFSSKTRVNGIYGKIELDCRSLNNNGDQKSTSDLYAGLRYIQHEGGLIGDLGVRSNKFIKGGMDIEAGVTASSLFKISNVEKTKGEIYGTVNAAYNLSTKKVTPTVGVGLAF